VATFSSNIHRIQQILDTTHRVGRKVALNGKSMIDNVRIAKNLGYLRAPAGLMVELGQLDGLPRQRAVLLTTGSQGEPMSALTRMAMDNHKQIKIHKGDTVVLSSKLIPGHEKTIASMMNHLYRRGAEVIYEKVSEVHVSGHASREELKIMLNMVRPRYFIPVHGEYRHLVIHGKLAKDVCVEEENVIIAEDGDVVEFTDEGARVAGRVESGKVFVDGKGVGDVSDMVLKDRKHLSRDGMVLAVVALNEKTGEIIYGPDIITRGLFLEQESPGLLEEARKRVMETLNTINVEAKTEIPEVEEEMRRALRRFFNRALERRPVILPLVLEI
jgi:ribonuclease J